MKQSQQKRRKMVQGQGKADPKKRELIQQMLTMYFGDRLEK